MEESGEKEVAVKEEKEGGKEESVSEQRIRKIALSYYSRKDILTYIFEFSKNREVSPRYFEGFGKRPDSFQYPNDIISLVKNGATSFHCSEELWKEPLEISTELSEEQLNELRNGWDLVIDIDCKWIEYSKKAAQAIIQALEFRGVNNIGIKFSGNKGFHIIIPWSAFPEELNEIKTKDMFPEWPRIIINYLISLSRPILEDKIKDSAHEFKDLKDYTGIKCENCNNLAQEAFQITLRCDNNHSPHIETFILSQREYKKKKCPICNKELKEISKNKFYRCNRCRLDSLKNPENFKQGIIATDIFKILGLDVLLVSSRHLFRMPYSLHEKTALASVVLDKNELEIFDLKDADPMNVAVKIFLPQCKKNEARELLIQALDWNKSKELEKPDDKVQYSEENKPKGKYEPVKLDVLNEDDFPPAIQKILKGVDDGRKRALFILINFYRSLGQSMELVDKLINEWNKKNKVPLKQGYINAQLQWHSKNKIVMPPNFDNEIYKAIGVYEMDNLSEKTKNPVNYVVRKSGAWKKQKKNR